MKSVEDKVYISMEGVDLDPCFKLKQFKLSFDFSKFSDNFASYLDDLNKFNEEFLSKAYMDYLNIIGKTPSKFQLEVYELMHNLKTLFENKPKIEATLRNVKKLENKIIENGGSKFEEGKYVNYFGKKSVDGKKEGEGIYSCKDQLIFYGEFENDFFKSGILIKKTDDNSKAHFYIGKFKKENESVIFDGVFYPNIDAASENCRAVSLICGRIIDENKIEGLVVYSSDSNNLFEGCEVVYGQIENYKKTGRCLVLKQDDDLYFITGAFKNNMPTDECHIWKANNYLFKVYYDEDGSMSDPTAIFLKLETGIFSGEAFCNQESTCNVFSIGNNGKIMFINNDIYEGGFSQGLKNGLTDYLIRDHETMAKKYIIRATFYKDKVYESNPGMNPEVTKVFKVDGEETKLLFEGEYKDGEIQHGTYYYSEKEKYKGRFKDFLRNGQGEYTFEDGSKLIGEWLDNMKNGQFNYCDSKGTKLINFKKDKQVAINL